MSVKGVRQMFAFFEQEVIRIEKMISLVHLLPLPQRWRSHDIYTLDFFQGGLSFTSSG